MLCNAHRHGDLHILFLIQSVLSGRAADFFILMDVFLYGQNPGSSAPEVEDRLVFPGIILLFYTWAFNGSYSSL